MIFLNMDERKKDINQKKNQEDRELILRILNNNDELAYKILEKKYSKIVANLIRKMIKDDDDVADLLQETFIKAFASLRSYKFEYSFSSWLYRIASNNCIDFIRRRKFHFVSIHCDRNNSQDEPFIEIPDEDKTADAKIIEQEKQEIINKAINELPEKYREIIKLRHIEELDYTQIAKRLGMPLGSVKANLFRARKILHLSLKRYKNILLQ